jgi:hypothetical protein
MSVVGRAWNEIAIAIARVRGSLGERAGAGAGFLGDVRGCDCVRSPPAGLDLLESGLVESLEACSAFRLVMVGSKAFLLLRRPSQTQRTWVGRPSRIFLDELDGWLGAVVASVCKRGVS